MHTDDIKIPDEWSTLPAGFGDKVKVIRTPETESTGFADQIGIVQGITKISVSGVTVIGSPTKDTALNIFFEELNESAWFTPELIAFVDHDSGTSMTLKGVPKIWTRDSSGEWIETKRKLPVKEWFAWISGVFRKMLR